MPQARRKKAGEARLFSEPHEVAGEAGDLVVSENVEFLGGFLRKTHINVGFFAKGGF